MIFSLINVSSEKDNKVSGYWIQNHIGTLESAKKVAKETEKVNSNKIDIAVVEEVSSVVPALCFHEYLERLN